MEEIYFVHGYEDYDGSREYVICDGPYKGNVYGWVETSVALDGSQRENYCCFEGSREACLTYIEAAEKRDHEEWIQHQLDLADDYASREY